MEMEWIVRALRDDLSWKYIAQFEGEDDAREFIAEHMRYRRLPEVRGYELVKNVSEYVEWDSWDIP